MWILASVVTLLGFVIAVVSLIALTRGDKLAQESGQPQKIEFKGIQFTTDRIGFLVLIGTAAMVGPFGFLAYTSKAKPADLEQCRASATDLKNQVGGLVAKIAEYEKVFGEPVTLTATVTDADGQPVRDGFEGMVERDDADGKRSEACARHKLINGDFTCRTPLKDLHMRFLFQALKAGSADPSGQRTIFPLEPVISLPVPP